MTDGAYARDVIEGVAELEDENSDVLDEVAVIDPADFERVVSVRADDGQDDRPATFLSTWLRGARMRAGIDHVRVSVLCGIDANRLRRIELGAVAPEAGELEGLCALYGCDIDRVPGLLPRLPSRAAVVDGALHVGTARLNVGPDRSNVEKLTDIAGLLRQMRGLPIGGVVRIRAAEITVVGSVLDLESEELLTELMTTLGLNATEAVELLALFVEVQTPVAERQLA